MQSVLRSLRVLEAVSEGQPIGVNELARVCELAPSTTQRILVTLAEAGWIRPTDEASRRWVLTARALVVGRRASGEVGLREVAAAPMTRLRDTMHETINLVLRVGATGTVMVERLDSDQPVRTYSPLGRISPMHGSASGRAIMAALEDDEVQTVIDAGLEKLTSRTIVDPDALRAELAQVRRLGYAVNRGENRPNVCSIGAVILDDHRRPVAAVSMSMPDSRWDEARLPEWAGAVQDTVREISAGLQNQSVQSF